VRHEHEWRVWPRHEPSRDPQLVADRILRYAQIAGRENVFAVTDCGLGGRVQADLAWARLRSLAEGARSASQLLWPRALDPT
jgi:5-methyltetrahydropteroyltriglutamate--homocysteine methyltransferase